MEGKFLFTQAAPKRASSLWTQPYGGRLLSTQAAPHRPEAKRPAGEMQQPGKHSLAAHVRSNWPPDPQQLTLGPETKSSRSSPFSATTSAVRASPVDCSPTTTHLPSSSACCVIRTSAGICRQAGCHQLGVRKAQLQVGVSSTSSQALCSLRATRGNTPQAGDVTASSAAFSAEESAAGDCKTFAAAACLSSHAQVLHKVTLHSRKPSHAKGSLWWPCSRCRERVARLPLQHGLDRRSSC